MLCRYCQDFPYDVLESENGYKHHKSWDDLCASARAGCAICGLVSKEPKPFGWETPDEPQLFCHLDETRPNIAWCERHGKDHYPRVELAIYDELASLITSRPVHESVMSEQSFEMMRRWLGRCTENHAHCPRPQAQQLPTRVIDVGIGGNMPRLVISEGQYGYWAALSHCWGGTLPLITKSSSLQDRCTGLLLEDLPATFKDALLITRGLGIQYLWIDALCIVQDCPKDWEVESSKMDHVYSKAAITIAAESSPDSSVGIVQSTKAVRKPLPSALCTSQKYGRKGFIHFRNATDIYSMDRGVLSTRGWTLQEELLSPRVLRFAPKQILWRCQSQFHREWFPEGGSYRHVEISKSLSQIGREFPVSRNRRSKHVKIAEERVLHYWYEEVLNKYNSRQLKFQKDRLVAISGIVKRLSPFLGSYKQGIWLDDYHVGLSWSAFAGAWKNLQFAPSWSWASIDSCRMAPDKRTIYNYDLEDLEPLCTVIETRNSDDLQLRGQCVRICSCRVPICFLDQRPVNSGSIFLADVANPENESRLELEMESISTQLCISGSGIIHKELLYFQLAEMKEERVVVALILEAVGNMRHTYRRIGRAFVPVISECLSIWPTWRVKLI